MLQLIKKFEIYNGSISWTWYSSLKEMSAYKDIKTCHCYGYVSNLNESRPQEGGLEGLEFITNE